MCNEVVDFSEDQCLGSGGTWLEDTPCDGNPCTVPVENDECDGALFIETGLHDFDTTEATTGPPLDDFTTCDPVNPVMHNDIWFALEVADFSFGAVSTCGTADFNTRLAIYHGSCDGDLQLIACNDDTKFCPNGTSEVFCDFPPGTLYIRIGGASENEFGTGMFRLDVFKGQ